MDDPQLQRLSRTRIFSTLAVAGIAAILSAGRVNAQVPPSPTFNPIESYSAKTLLRRAAEQADQKQWAEAIDLYQKVIAESGGAVARIPKEDPMADATGSVQLFVDARQHAQARLAALPPEALVAYRTRVDAQAERLFRKGLADRDRGPLREVVDDLFASSWADDALEVLGDLAFRDGQFGEALAMYRRIVPDSRSGAAGLNYPDPDVDLARVAAKALLARAALGLDPPTPNDLRAYSSKYPGAKGALAGRDGPYATSVASAIADDHLAPLPDSDGRWPTFAGSMSRSRIAPGPIDVGQFQWRVPLIVPPVARASAPMPMRGFGGNFGGQQFGPPPPAIAPDVQLAYHPIILGDEVIICDEVRVHAYKLNAKPPATDGDAANSGSKSSDPLLAWSAPPPELASAPPARAVGPGAPRFTLSASGDLIFARLGGAGRASASTLVALRNNQVYEGYKLWELAANEVPLPRARPDAPNRMTATFEGAPVADSRSVYIGMSEGGATETSLFVASFDAETKALRWIRALGSAPSTEGGGGGFNNQIATPAADIGNRLLSLDGQTIYYQTNLGALAALDTETGAIRWLATYTPRDRAAPAPARDANPAVVHDGLVMIAPDDALPLFAFDAATGRLAWKTPPLERISHLLGVAKGRLIATGDRVYSLDVKDGKLKAAWPDGASGFDPYGRGLLAGDSIYWPTKTDIYVLDQATGAPGEREPIRLNQHYGTGGGNLTAGNGYLVVAQKDGLVAFAQSGRVIEQIRREIAADPGRAAPYFQLARVAETTGRDEEALANLTEARSRAKPSDLVDGRPLAEEAKAKQYKLLVKLANKARDTGDWAARASRLSTAVEAATSDRDKLSARLSLAAAQDRAGDKRGAVVTLQAILSDESLRSRVVPGDTDDRWTVRADLLVADLLESILKTGGRELYASFDIKADALLDEGRKSKSTRALEEVSRAYPVARATPESLLALASLREEEKDLAGAAQAYKRAANNPVSTDLQRARGLLGLARSQSSLGLASSARESLARAQSAYASLRMGDLGLGSGTVGSYVTDTLTRAPFDKERVGADRSVSVLPLPLTRTWERSWPAPLKPMLAEGSSPSATTCRVLLSDRTSIRPIDPISGGSAWTFDLGEEPLWAGYLGDRLIVATAGRVVALDPSNGDVRWRYPNDSSQVKKTDANPFATRPGVDTPASTTSSGRLHDVRLAGSRVICLRGDNELIALDGDSGGLDWTFRGTDGVINPNILAGSKRVVLQLAAGSFQMLMVLDAETGRRQGEFGRPGDETSKPWSRPPLAIDDDHACVTLDPQTVALLELSTGTRVWTSRVPTTSLPRYGPPRLLGNSSHLLALYEGNELIRLDPATGRRIWTRSLGPEDLSESPDAFALGIDRLYCATGATLSAFDMKDGDPVWLRPLTGPRSGWSLALTDRHIAAFPGSGKPNDSGSAGDGLPLVVCRRDDGALIQRLTFPADPAGSAVVLLPRGAVVATKAGVWALGPTR